MSEAVVQAERELFAYVIALEDALRCAAEDALPESLWEGSDVNTEGGGVQWEGGEVPDTLRQRVEQEMAAERHRVYDVVRLRLAPQHAALCAAITQLGGGRDGSGNVIDVPVDVLDRDIAAAAAESAELGRRMVELYDEAAAAAARMESELLRARVPPL